MKCPACLADNQADSRYCSRCATPLPGDTTPSPFGYTKTLIAAFENLQRGSVFAGRYEIIEEIGKGGMGRVFKAFDRQIKEVVALKLLKPEIGFNAKAVERFKNELKFARRIAHPRVCRLYDLGETGLAHYLTMEYVEGEDLKAFIRRSGHITTPKAINIARQIAEGLSEAHRLGVVHRDLKPQNVMIDREGQAKIMDFGLARFADNDGVTGPGLLMGTPEYMSPEQVDLKEVDARVDLYALGIILYEMVTGHVPFKGETPLAVAIKQKSERARDARETNPLIPESLINVIAKCLEKEPNRRYQTSAELIAALDEIGRNLPAAVQEISRTAGRGSSLHLRPKRRRWIFVVPIAAVGLILAMAILFEKPAPKTPPRPAGAAAPSGPQDEAALAGRIFSRFLTSNNQNDIQDVEKALGSMEKFLPEKGPAVDAWNQVRDKIFRSRDSNPPGRSGRPPSSAPEVKGEMQQLMSLISERESAQKAREAMAATKTRVQKRLSPERNFLLRVARFEEANAADAFAKNDYAGSRALFRLLERIYNASPRGENGAQGVEALRGILKTLQIENQTIAADKIDPWLASSAREIEAQAETFAAKGDVENACGAFVRAAFLLEKIKDAA
jgi:serine/threonine protein kinase